VPALLIVNPHATATTELRRDVITHALASQMELEVAETRYRGHAGTLARKAASDGFQLIVTLGGDGTVNEAVNGLLHGLKPGTDPAFAPVPGGNANVFSRALGLPADPVDATGRILEALRTGRDRRVGLGASVGGVAMDGDAVVPLKRGAERAGPDAGRRNDRAGAGFPSRPGVG